MYLSERLAEYALSLRYEDLSREVLAKTKQHIVDTLACGLGALDAEPVKAAIRLARLFPAQSSSIFAQPFMTTPDMAAFVNGTFTRAAKPTALNQKNSIAGNAAWPNCLLLCLPLLRFPSDSVRLVCPIAS